MKDSADGRNKIFMNLRDSFVGYDDYVYETLKKYKLYVLLIISLFVVGFIFGISYKDIGNNFIKQVLGGIFGQFHAAHGIKLFLKIFIHNLLAALFAVTGILFSIIPVTSSLFNGVIVGCVLFLVKDLTGLNIGQLLILLLPHGIFEIPAFILSLSIGVHLGTWPFRKNKIDFIKKSLGSYIKAFYKIIFPLLLLAALIEATMAESFYLITK